MLQVDALFEGFMMLMDWWAFFYILLGLIVGVFFGAIPGLSGGTAFAVLLPMTFVMSQVHAIVFLCAIYLSSIYGGSISAVLINIPGQSSAIMTTLDGYPMTKKGDALRALSLALGASIFGGIISYIILLLFMQPLAEFALKFSSPEMAVLILFTIITITAFEKNLLKSLTTGFFGFLLGTVGIATSGTIRGTFGITELMDGIPFVPALMGLFALSEMLAIVDKTFVSDNTQKIEGYKKLFYHSSVTVFKHPWLLLKSSLLGTFIGALPAAGGSIASIVAYQQAKDSRPDKPFGAGIDEGIIAPESSNNASSGGALMTMLAFGIPGSVLAGMMLGALMMQGMSPGVRFFSQQTSFCYAIIISLFFASVLLYLIANLAAPGFSKMISVPNRILVPVITVFCLLGSYSGRYTLFDCSVMFVFGIIGYVFKKFNYPLTGLLIGLLLGSLADYQIVQTYVSFRGDMTVLFTRPISFVIWILCILFIVLPRLPKKRKLGNRLGKKE
jgi:putative tricarboxylic transport membrane protein